MRATLQKLGAVSSFSRPKVSDDNPYSESLIKTLEYCPKYSDQFENKEKARRWGIKFTSPLKRHLGLDKNIFEDRHRVL